MKSTNFIDIIDLNPILNEYANLLQTPMAVIRNTGEFAAKTEIVPFDLNINLNDYPLPQKDPLIFQYSHKINGIITPLQITKEIDGYFIISYSPQTKLEKWIKDIAQLISRQLVQLITKEIKIYAQECELTERYGELGLLYEVSEVLNNIFDVREATQRILSKAMEVLGVDKGSVMLLDKSGTLTIFASKGIPKEIVKKTNQKIGEGVAGKIAKTGEPLISENIEQEAYYENKAYKQYRSGAFMSLPISLPTAGNRRKILGVLNLNDKLTGEPFNANDLKIASTIATQAAIFIENTRNYENILNEKKKLETILTDMGDGVILTDENFSIILINQSACRILNVAEKDGIDQNYFEFIAPHQLSVPLNGLKNPALENVQYEMITQEHPLRACSVNMTRIYNKNRKLVNTIILLRDITQERTQELMKTEFLSLISHKLRTPLVGLVGYPQFLLDGTLGQLNDQQRQAVETIEKQSLYLSRLVDQLLRFTELESQKLELHIEAQHPYLLLKAAIDNNYKAAKQKNVEIQLRTKDLPPFIYVDGERIVEILDNLIQNAVKFSHENGDVEVYACKLNASYVQITVTDHGIGIEPKHLENIFDRFYQVEDYFTGQIEGAGLGLSVVRHLVEAHQGKVWAESQFRKGSKFVVQLPSTALKSLAKYGFEIE